MYVNTHGLPSSSYSLRAARSIIIEEDIGRSEVQINDISVKGYLVCFDIDEVLLTAITAFRGAPFSYEIFFYIFVELLTEFIISRTSTRSSGGRFSIFSPIRDMAGS